MTGEHVHPAIIRKMTPEVKEKIKEYWHETTSNFSSIPPKS